MFKAVSGALALAAVLWALLIWLLGGFRIAFLIANDPVRPLLVSLVTAIVYVGLSGREGIHRDLRRHRSRLVTMLALILALSPAVAGLARNSWTAGGADSFAYVSQADLWLHSRLKTPVPIASFAPWPNAIWTFAPYGYRPDSANTGLVPVTAPGLPLLMAGAKFLAGQHAMFWITPLTGALLVWMTFAIGRTLGSDTIGLAAAWLVATSPAFLAMLVSPMSDVPAAAFWTLAIYFALRSDRGLTPVPVRGSDPMYCGLATSAAILIRPNLAPLAIVIAGWMALTAITVRRKADTTDTAAAPVVSGFSRTALMLAGILPGCLLVACLNWRLYGSPFTSGYGGFDTLFSLANVGTNLQRYGRWLLESQTPFALVGIAMLAIPARAIWPTRAWQRAAWLLASIVGAVWALYIIYTPFDAWWYLRFLLPCWPAMCLGLAALLVRLMERPQIAWRVGAAVVLIGVGIHGIYFASRYGAFPSGEGDHRYASIAKLAEQFTEPSSVIITGQNTGPTRYYGGRATIRFDLLDPQWLDRAVHWLTEHNRHPYFLLEDWELPLFQQRFSPQNNLGALGFSPVMAYRAPGVPGSVFLFDPARPAGPTLRPVPPPSARQKCVEPGPEPLLSLEPLLH